MQSREPHSRPAPDAGGTRASRGGSRGNPSRPRRPRHTNGRQGEHHAGAFRGPTRAHGTAPPPPPPLRQPGTRGWQHPGRDLPEHTRQEPAHRPARAAASGIQERSRVSGRPHTRPRSPEACHARPREVPESLGDKHRVTGCQHLSAGTNGPPLQRGITGPPHGQRGPPPCRARGLATGPNPPQHHSTVTRAPGPPGPSGRPCGGG